MMMMWNCWNHSSSLSSIRQLCGVTVTPSTRSITRSAAMIAFDFPMSCGRNKNWRFRLLTSMVSISMTSIFLNPLSARSFSSSHPSPPAPRTKTCITSISTDFVSSPGSKPGPADGPPRMST